jgi:hypothetical protein
VGVAVTTLLVSFMLLLFALDGERKWKRGEATLPEKLMVIVAPLFIVSSVASLLFGFGW